MTHLQTCRLCKQSNYDSPEQLVKYGVRHNVHLLCALNKWGLKFIEELPLHWISKLSLLTLMKYPGALQAAEARYVKLSAEAKEREALHAR